MHSLNAVSLKMFARMHRSRIDQYYIGWRKTVRKHIAHSTIQLSRIENVKYSCIPLQQYAFCITIINCDAKHYMENNAGKCFGPDFMLLLLACHYGI